MLSKRQFLLSSVASVALHSTAKAAFTSFSLNTPVVVPASFGGNPNVTITAISTAGGIACSRTSGMLPCFVQVSASAITATGTSWPYEDLEYSWNFGDASGAETFDQFINVAGNKAASTIVNANTGQTGPEAAYVYRSAGTKTITLTIRGKNGASFTTATATQNITVSAFNHTGGEYWVDSVAGSDSNAGTSSGAPFATLNKVITSTGGFGAALSNVAVHLKAGSHWINDGLGLTNCNGFRVDSYGAGAKPIIERNDAFYCIGFETIGSHNQSDCVVSNIDMRLSSGTSETFVAGVFDSGGASSSFTDMYWDNCDFSTSTNTNASALQMDVVAFNPPEHSDNNNAGMWNCTFTNPTTSSSHLRIGLAIQGWHQWAFVVGGSFVGAGTGSTLDHHMYPIVQNHFYCGYIHFGSGPNRGYCINTDWNNTTTAVASNVTGSDPITISGGLMTIPAGDMVDSANFQVGMTIYCTAGSPTQIPLGVTITSFGTGSGQAGTYHLSNSGFTASVDRVDGVAAVNYAEFLSYNSLYFSGVTTGFDADDFTNNAASMQWRNFVCQKCCFDNLSLGGTDAQSLLSITMRDNLAWGVAGNGFFFPGFGAGSNTLLSGLSYKCYRNKVYQSAGQTIIVIPTNYAPITATKPLQITDNQIWDTRAAAVINTINFSENGTSIIDRNQYYAPSDSDAKFLFNGVTAETFVQWQTGGFDTNGSVGAFSWTSPSTGDFS